MTPCRSRPNGRRSRSDPEDPDSGASWVFSVNGGDKTGHVAAQMVPDGVDYHVQFETLVYDTDGFYDAATPDRLIIPETGGYQLATYAQVGGGFAIGDGWIVIERYNSAGTLIGSYPASWITGYTARTSPMIDCVEGDYFRLLLRQNSGADKNLFVNNDRNFLSLTLVF